MRNIFIILLIIAISIGSAYVGYSFVQRKEAIYAYTPGGQFITNIKDNTCLIKTDLVIEVTDRAKYKKLNDSTYKVRDLIINVLRSKTYDEMMNPSIQETLKTQIIGRINEEFNLNAADNIYFNEFVLQ